MSNRSKKISFAIICIALLLGVVRWRAGATRADGGTNPTAVKPALTVTTASPQQTEWPELLSANGTIAAWQEASIGAEVNGLRLTDIMVNVGDAVHQGQILAVFSDTTVKADVAQSQAAVAEAEAVLAEARANADRARQAEAPGALSAQQISEYLTGERTAAARLQSARAQLANQQTRLRQTQLVAPDDGVISARSATVGSVAAVGQELFRLIRRNRLEWRAEVTAADLPKLRPGQNVTLSAPGDLQARGTVRMVAPTVDPQSRIGLVYVDIPPDSGLKPGMFARGAFELGQKAVLALPQSAIVQREGFSFVYRLGADNKVGQIKVETGRRRDKDVEIVGGLEQNADVVTTGTAFLADGDTVRVVHPVEGPSGKTP